ncbi:hypothetical protein BDV96DRAFT_596911 [Lophiotrema nucula]|uniref:Zn(2)-C6 fungal-type domain-containing protein n=1 Tax=Lophiotrema nucula TaxID=690887 RepID=A0A6A5ZI27_9PLEO|nr:hypothetical protein BDV96DRAFT_596911 [Lophiotrema nucula]
MLPSSSSSSFKKNERPSKPASPANSNPSATGEPAELSDVQCYTCRRRHVKCDRTLPNCVKCAKKGVPCLGYQKPLRWAEGVAVRGKLKGKSQPVVDKDFSTDVAKNQATLFELMSYHNSVMCTEQVTFEQSKFIDRSIAPISYDKIRKLPRDIVNCILGNAAVHMASRQPESRPLERLALETKAAVYQSFNRRLQEPQNQTPDTIVCCGGLIFAMDLFEHGMARWTVHFLGSMNVMSSFGGLENLCTYYPHLQLTLAHMSHFETFWPILSPIAVTRPKQCSRGGLEMVLSAPAVKRRFFNPCPLPLTLVIWDTCACASKLLGDHHVVTVSDLHQREHILLDVMKFRPEDAIQEVKDFYYSDVALPEARVKNWNAISAAWKGAITILVLRYLYFGRPSLAPDVQVQRSRTPSFETNESSWYSPRNESGPYYHTSDFPDLEDSEALPEYLNVGLEINDLLSRSPSPFPLTEPPSTMLWDKRFEIHDEAFKELSTSFFALHDTLPPICLRYIILPLCILALVSSPGSTERTVCFSYFQKFKEFMTANYPRDLSNRFPRSPERTKSPSPQGGEELDIKIPWEQLDAFSAVCEQQRHNAMAEDDAGVTYGAPEWNWWDMLHNTKLDMTCKSSRSSLAKYHSIGTHLSHLWLLSEAQLLWWRPRSNLKITSANSARPACLPASDSIGYQHRSVGQHRTCSVAMRASNGFAAGPITSGTSHFERGHEFWAFKLISSIINDECFEAWTAEQSAPQASSSASFA